MFSSWSVASTGQILKVPEHKGLGFRDPKPETLCAAVEIYIGTASVSHVYQLSQKREALIDRIKAYGYSV